MDLNGTFGEVMWKGEVMCQAPEGIPKKSERATRPWRWGQGITHGPHRAPRHACAVAACVSSAQPHQQRVLSLTQPEA